MKKKIDKKPKGEPPVPVSMEDKILQEMKLMNDTLNGIKNILDNMWRERLPQ